MTHSDRTDSDPPWKVYRGPDDVRCPCPYCTAIRDGTLPPIDEPVSVWLQRMGGMPAR